MKSFRKELWFELPARRGFVNITPQVEAVLRERGLHGDFETWLEKLAPEKPHVQDNVARNVRRSFAPTT